MSSQIPQSILQTRPVRDVEEAVQVFSEVGVDLHLERLRNKGDFSLDFKAFRMGAAQLLQTAWGTDLWGRVNLPGRVAIVLNLTSTGPNVFTTAGNSVSASATSAPIIQSGRETSLFRRQDSPLIAVTAKIKDLERHFGDLAGTDHVRLDFAPGLNRESPEGERFQRAIDFAIHELRGNPTAIDNPIVRRQLDELILGGILALPGEHHSLINLSSKGSVGLTVVRCAEEFMEANAGDPIVMSDVAKECGCSRTKLFEAFKKERGWTPLQFLVRRRMERARRLLLRPNQRSTVATVSLDCGYPNFSRFAQEYRKIYGETPSMTLNRSCHEEDFCKRIRRIDHPMAFGGSRLL